MRPTQKLHEAGQSIWLDNITRGLLDSGTLQKYVNELSVTGLTSNPTIFDQAISKGADYDDGIRALTAKGRAGEDLFFDLAIEDLTRAADIFKPIHERTNGVDGYVSLELSPTIAFDTKTSIAEAKTLWTRANRKNLFIKIPGTAEGLPAIEESIFAGIPINVTLLFSPEQYVAAAEAYIRGVERRVAAGLNPHVASVASLFLSRWDVAVHDKVPAALDAKLGIAIAQRAYKAYRELFASDRWQRLVNFGARSQRILWASTGTKDPKLPDTLYVTALAAPHTVDTMPEKTLLALGDHGEIGAMMRADGGDADKVLGEITRAGIDLDALAAKLQKDGAESFVKSWTDLLSVLEQKSAKLKRAG